MGVEVGCKSVVNACYRVWRHTSHRQCQCRISGGVFVMVGALASLEFVWNLGDLCMALLTACNLMAIVMLGKYVFRLLDDYRRQKRNGIKEPTFHRSQLPEIEKDIDCWN